MSGVPVAVEAGSLTTTVRVCTGSNCVAHGSLAVADAFETAIAEAEATERIRVVRTGCHGLCQLGPVTIVGPDAFYPKVTPAIAHAIADELASTGLPVEQHLYRETRTSEPVRDYRKLAFSARQKRIVMRNFGHIDPENIDDALAHGVYGGLRTALTSQTPEQIVTTVEQSGLRGRGGAGYPTGQKWAQTREASAATGATPYVICNADEGDPGAYMDRSLLESDPHGVLEGVALAAYAVGADEAYVYCRSDYSLAMSRVQRAIRDAEDRGLLGEDVLGSGFSLHVHLIEGIGAFVCGEETALIATIEGRRGFPTPRPPYPATSGLRGRPTVTNNAETFANIGWIVTHGAEAYAAVGTAESAGTKVFALTGKVRHGGLVEVEMGTTLREIVEVIGGGVEGDHSVMAVQVGGPSGGCLPVSLLDTPVAYGALMDVGTIVGSGGIVVVDETSCIVDLARYFLSFTQHESCGKCVPCRVGTKRMLEIVTRITEGTAWEGDLDTLEELAHVVKSTSLCGLGKTAPNPVLTTLEHFRQEYVEHVLDKKCRAGVCAALSRFEIVPDLCKGCGVCRKNCPAGAITGKTKEPHLIDQDLCVKCGICFQKCPFEAIDHL